MKHFSTFQFLCFCLFGSTLFAQEAMKKVHIKYSKEVNGELTQVDTIITLAPGQDHHQVMKDLGLDINMGKEGLHTHDEDVNIWVNKEGDDDKKVEKHVIKLHSGDLSPEKKAELEEMLKEKGMSLEEFETSDGKKKITIHKHAEGKEGEEKEIEIKVNVESDGEGDEKVMIWKDDEGTVHDLKGEGNVFVFKSGEGDNKMVHVTVNGENFDAEKLKKLAEEGNTEKIMEELKVEVKVSGEGDEKEIEVVESIEIKILIEDPNEEEKQVLKDAGAQIGNNLALKDLEFYPNPSAGKFSVGFESPETGDLSVRIMDINGREVYRENRAGFSGVYKKEINISTEPKGVYLLTVSHNGKVSNKRIVLD